MIFGLLTQADYTIAAVNNHEPILFLSVTDIRR